MADRDLIIYGAGGHGLVVAESAEAAGRVIRGFVDDRLPLDAAVGRWRVIGRGDAGWDEMAETAGGGVIVAVGDNAARQKVINDLLAAGVELATVVDPTARVSRSARVERGGYVGAGAVVNAEAVVGVGCIVNSGAIVEHHVRVGAAAHVAPGAVLTGRARVGAGALIGANATVLPGRSVGDEAKVGAGAVVTQDVPAKETVVGCPARPVSAAEG